VKTRSGFSIIEIMVVMAIIAGMVILARPLFSGITSLKLKEETSELIRVIRGHFAQASLLGLTYRVVLEIKTDKETNVETTAYWVEASKEEARAGVVVKEEEERGLWVGDNDKEKELKEKYRKKPNFLPLKDKYGKRHELPSPVRLSGVWVEGMKERLREGTFYLYFSPMGFTQRAQISLTDDKKVFVLFVEPLTGEVSIENEEKPVS
jgi:prepilin-type N-terminal cleavage/methylation domain-containing protein